MILADAIETWGQTYRDRLTQSQLEKLGTVWATIKRSEVGGRTVSTMTKEDAGQVMGLFPEHDRAEIADLLNTVRKWTLTHAPPAAAPVAAAPVTPVQPEPWPQPDPVQAPPAAAPFPAPAASPFDTGLDRTQAMPAATTAIPQVYDTAPTVAPAPDPSWGAAPAQPAYGTDQAAVTSVQGPPPSTFAPPKSDRPSLGILLGGVLVAALVATVGYLLFIRDTTDTPMPATTTTTEEPGVTTTDGTTTGTGQATVGTDAGTTGAGTASVGTGTGESDEDRTPVDRDAENGAVDDGSGTGASTTTTDATTTTEASTAGEAPAADEAAPEETTDPNAGAATSSLDGETITSGSATVGLGSGEGSDDDRTSVDRDDADG